MNRHKIICCKKGANVCWHVGVHNDVGELAVCVEVGERECPIGLAACMERVGAQEIRAVAVGASGGALA